MSIHFPSLPNAIPGVLSAAPANAKTSPSSASAIFAPSADSVQFSGRFSRKTPEEKVLAKLTGDYTGWGWPTLKSFLIRKDVSVNLRDDQGNTLVMLAMKEGYYLTSAGLLEMEADVNVRNKAGVTPLMTAAQSQETVSLAWMDKILMRDANPNRRDNNMNAALFYLIAKCRDEDLACQKLELLADYKVNMDLPNDKGVTPLMLAASLGKLKLVKALLKAGADPTLRDDKGKTAHDYAQELPSIGSRRVMVPMLKDAEAAGGPSILGGNDLETSGEDAPPASLLGKFQALDASGRERFIRELMLRAETDASLTRTLKALLDPEAQEPEYQLL